MTHDDLGDGWRDPPEADPTELAALIPDDPMADLDARAARLTGYVDGRRRGGRRGAAGRGRGRRGARGTSAPRTGGLR